MMKKFMLVMALLSGYSNAGTVVLANTTTNSCTYSALAMTASGDVVVSCAGANPPVQPPAITPTTPAHCTIKNITWTSAQITTYQGGVLHTLLPGETYAFKYVPQVRSRTGTQTVYATAPTYMSISKNACEFTPELEAARCAGVGGNDALVYNNSDGIVARYSCGLVAGQTYYINVKNASSYNGATTCLDPKGCTFNLNW